MKKSKKMISLVLAAFMLVTILTISVSARYGMGGTTIGNLGDGYLYSDQYKPWTAYAETVSSSSEKSVGAQAGIYVHDYVRNERYDSLGSERTSSTGKVTSYEHTLSDTSRYWPLEGIGYFTIGSTTKPYRHAWNG